MKKMEKKPTVIIFMVSLILLAIFLVLWIFIVLFPFLEYAQFLSDLGITYGGTVFDILELLFLNLYFIGAIVCGIIAIIFRIIARKSL